MKRLFLGALCATASFVAIGSLDAASTTTEVVKVVDGDTFDAEVFGKVQRVRMLGINSTETGECHASAAKDWLESRIEGRRVKLTAQDPNVKLNFGRPARFVDLGTDDIGAEMIELGLVIPYPHATETARNDKYLDLAATAKSRGIGVWDDDSCGSGPAQSSGLRLEVRWDAEENDGINVNGEWIDVFNPSKSAVNLTGWVLRDASTRFYNFPAGTRVNPGRYVRVHIGSGTDTSTDKYWGLDHPIFKNDLDEAAYLFDPDGDLRDSFEYRCRIDCVNDYTALTLSVNYDAAGDDNTNPNGEWIDIFNRSHKRVYLYGTYVENYPNAYHFEPQHSVPPLGGLRVYVGQGVNTSTALFLGKTRGIFANAGETVTLTRKDGLVLEEFTYPLPGSSCTRTPGRLTPSGSSTGGDISNIGDPMTAVASAKRIGVRCR